MIIMIKFEFIFQTVNGIEYKEIYENFEDGTCDLIGRNVKTPNCGWKQDSINPECSKGCEGCIFTRILIEEIGGL